jgi:twitching motility protein PilT
VSGAGGDAAALVAAALRERPDVLVIEDLGSPDVALMAVDAARSGCLVIGGLTATTTKAAVYRIVSHAAPDRRSEVESALDSSLRGVIAQLLVRKKRGGWAAAREVWLNRHLVSPMNDALAELVLENVVDPREAYGQAPDKTGLLAALARHGLDTSFAERDR